MIALINWKKAIGLIFKKRILFFIREDYLVLLFQSILLWSTDIPTLNSCRIFFQPPVCLITQWPKKDYHFICCKLVKRKESQEMELKNKIRFLKINPIAFFQF